MSKFSVWAAASTADELGRDLDGAFDAAVQPATVDPDTAAFDPTKFDESLDKRTAARGGRLLPNSPASTQWSESGKSAARAGSGHATLAAPVLLMKSRRRTASPKAPDHARLRRQGLHYIRDLSPVKWARRPLCRAAIVSSACRLWVHTLHFCDVRVVAAFHPIATKSRTSRHFGFGPGAHSCTAATSISIRLFRRRGRSTAAAR